MFYMITINRQQHNINEPTAKLCGTEAEVLRPAMATPKGPYCNLAATR